MEFFAIILESTMTKKEQQTLLLDAYRKGGIEVGRFETKAAVGENSPISESVMHLIFKIEKKTSFGQSLLDPAMNYGGGGHEE
jgi:hypothetical protein